MHSRTRPQDPLLYLMFLSTISGGNVLRFLPAPWFQYGLRTHTAREGGANTPPQVQFS